jgi:hypothetical protein
MDAWLRLESTLEHDGDGLARFILSGKNAEFSASIGTWGPADGHLKLASALQGFPSVASPSLSYRFGTTGTCELAISCLDTLGHLGIWATFTGDWPVPQSELHQTAALFIRSDPASLDSFVSELQQFVRGAANRATLSGLGP